MEFLIFFNLTFNSILKRTDKTAILIRLGILAKAVQYEYKRKGGFSKHFKKKMVQPASFHLLISALNTAQLGAKRHYV